MKLASLKEGGRDGTLVVATHDLSRAVRVRGLYPTLQSALDDWETAVSALREVYARLNEGTAPGAFLLDPRALAAPLPRAYHWVDGSAYLVHVELVRKARGAEVPESFYTDPLVYQGGSDDFVGPHDPIVAVSEDMGIDLEAEVAVITDDVPMGTTLEEAGNHIKLVMLVNDVTLRNLIPNELAKGFGFYQSKPSTAFSPVAVTPDELGTAWDGGKVSLPLVRPRPRQAFRPSQCRHRSDLRFPPVDRPCRTHTQARRGHHHRFGHRRQSQSGCRRVIVPGRTAHGGDFTRRQAQHSISQIRRSRAHRNVRCRRGLDLRRHRPDRNPSLRRPSC